MMMVDVMANDDSEWVFKSRGTQIAGWLIMEISLKWMIWGYPYFWKPPNRD